MEGFFFGDAQALYGAYHAPDGAAQGVESAVLVCQGMGHEYMRLHRTLWQFAELAARRNVHVMRFDYHGTGDSQGRVDTPRWSRWLDDVRVALAELRSRSGLSRVSVMGVRVGGLLAAEATRSEAGVEQLILLDPVVDGRLYMRELLDLHIAYERERNRYRPGKFAYAEADTDEYVGFYIPDALADALASRTLSGQLTSHPALSISVVATHQAADDVLGERVRSHLAKVVVAGDTVDWQAPGLVNRRLALPRSTPELIDMISGAPRPVGSHR